MFCVQVDRFDTYNRLMYYNHYHILELPLQKLCSECLVSIIPYGKSISRGKHFCERESECSHVRGGAEQHWCNIMQHLFI